MVTQQELIESHNKGFGGSDAKMLAKIGRNGIESLSTTDIKRVLQILGRYEAKPFDGNVYTEAGHQFEEWMRGQDATYGYKQEFRLDLEHAAPFAIFAHADFYDPNNGEVVECKFSQSTTDEVLETYWEQLQWYYMLGANAVVLAHGFGDVFPFAVGGVNYVTVERDSDTIGALVDGIDELSNAIHEGYFNEITADDMDVRMLPVEHRDAVATIVTASAEIKRYEKMLADARDVLCEAMGKAGVLNITGEGFKITYVSPTTKRSFDSKKAIKDFPQLDDDKYYKTSNVKASIRITMKENTTPPSRNS